MALNMVFYRFLDLNQLLGRVKRSNLVQSVCNTCGDMCEVLLAAITHDITYKTLKVSVKVTEIASEWRFWLFFGPKSTCRARYWFKLGPDCF